MLIYNMNVLLPGADTASAVGEANGEPVEITADLALVALLGDLDGHAVAADGVDRRGQRDDAGRRCV